MAGPHSCWRSRRRKPAWFQVLIENGADVNVKGNDGRSALKLAVQQGYGNIMGILTEAGATQ